MSKSTIITALVLTALNISTASASMPWGDDLNQPNQSEFTPADLIEQTLDNAEPTPLPLLEESLNELSELEMLNLGWCKLPTEPISPTPLPLPDEYSIDM